MRNFMRENKQVTLLSLNLFFILLLLALLVYINLPLLLLFHSRIVTYRHVS